MNLKIQIKNYVKENSKNDKDWKYNSANYLSQKLQVSRNIVSQYLNEFVRDGSFGKINSRPVLFFKLPKHSDVPVVFSNLVDARKWYQSVQEVGLDRVIGNTGSLKRIITEIKAAIQYPPNGLPILLMGSTGTGKSYLANMIYQHLMLHHNINKQSKFISINCSEYSNNPELFLANLFGVVRGAYTGAITDKKGIIELADNGVLFLDEIHSLNKECQEKLFQFMDTNKFHRLGDNEKVCESHCWIIFATSEDPKQYILPTLLRRIPVKISLPNLSNRTIYEKRELISEFFKHESHRLKKEIVLSYSLLDFLLNYTFKENVGNLKNVIQLTCANAYSHQLSSKIVKIKLADLPNEMAKMTHKMNIRYPINKYLKLSELSQNYGQLSFNQLINYFYYHWQSNPDNNHLFNDFDHYLKRHFLSNLQLTTNESYLEIKLNQFVKENEEYYQTEFDNFYITLTKLFLDSWLYQADNINITTKQLAEFNQMLKDTAGQALNLSEQFLQFCDIDVSLSSKIILTVLFKLMSGKEFQQRKLALIIAHGDNVASSIATTTNLLMKKYIFDAIDMPLTIDNNEVVKRVNNYLLGRINFKELLIFVDMGSLEKIIPQLRISDQQKVGILNNVSTGIALEAANQYINLNVPLNDILSNIKNNQKIQTYYKAPKQKQDLIICSCASGLGTSHKLKQILKRSLPANSDINIITCDYYSLAKEDYLSELEKDYHVLFIVGTLNPNLEKVRFYSIEDLILGIKVQDLSAHLSQHFSDTEIKSINNQILKNFSLTNLMEQLTILNPNKLLSQVSDALYILQNELHLHLDNKICFGLYVHICCLIERLVTQSNIHDEISLNLNYKQEQFYKSFKMAFTVVENYYSVEISIDEVMYVYDYIKKA